MSSCPISYQKSAAMKAGQCPVAHDLEDINPLNQVPFSLSQSAAPHQSMSLSIKRETSSIPRAVLAEESESSNWMYPSPQQFYNALTRKGYDMPEEQMSTMVQLHNFLNEEAWLQVLKWEKRWDPQYAVSFFIDDTLICSGTF